MTPILEQANPIRVLMRLVGVGLIVCCGWMSWMLIAFAVAHWETGALFTVSYLATNSVLLALGVAVAISMVRAPNRLHLGLTIAVALLIGHFSLIQLTQSAVQTVFVPEVVEPAAWALGWVQFLALCLYALFVEWWFSKRAGFVGSEERWWQEDNIRVVCIGLGWLMFFAYLLSPVGSRSDQIAIFNEPYGTYFTGFGFLAWIAVCVVFARRMPVALMMLTGVEMKPTQPKERRRGFRLW